MRAMKGKRQLTMLYVDTEDEARAAAEAGIDMLSIIVVSVYRRDQITWGIRKPVD